jgi:hypothetical protein
MRKIIWGLAIITVLAFIGIVIIIKHVDKKLANSDTAAPSQNKANQIQLATGTPTRATSMPLSLPVKYNNQQYGFIFSLPADWQGYSIYAKQWDGCPLGGAEDCSKAIHGPQIFIRNPNWTQANPYEDIPIMIFSLNQWSLVSQEKMAVSAAPFLPSELGRNQKYVFALPPRYNYDFRKGFEEVEKIMQSNPLAGY